MSEAAHVRREFKRLLIELMYNKNYPNSVKTIKTLYKHINISDEDALMVFNEVLSTPISLQQLVKWKKRSGVIK
jgi:hypothetical protein